MPIYEYRCPDCGHEFDALQKVSDAPLTDCPSCAGTGLKKLISRTSFALKGGGWYKDHYGLKGGGSSSSSGGGASSGGSAASSSSSSSSSSGSGGGSAKSE
jgi:putative FmdB family regulatory protein